MSTLFSPKSAVVVVTILLLATALASVAIWGRNIGMAEDWLMVPAMTGNQDNLLAWLWSQNNEHRLPVQRLIYLGLLRATADFRSGMVLSQLLLVFLVFALVRAATGALGGRIGWSAVLFPLALLHLGHWENLIWGWQFQFVWSVLLTGLLLAIVVAQSAPIGLQAGLASALLLLLLPISGANGIVTAVAMTPWLAAQGVVRLVAEADENDRRMGIALIAAAMLSLVVTGLYFVGYVSPEWSPPLASPMQFLSAAETYFAYALGPGTRAALLPAAVVVILFTGVGCAMAVWAFYTAGPKERLRAGGLALFIGSGVALGLAISLARGGYPYRMPDRYALMAVLPLLGAAFAWALYAPPRIGQMAVAGLAMLFLLMLPLNVRAGFEWRNWYVDGMLKVEADISAGVPISELAARHYSFLVHWSEELLRKSIEQLHASGIGPFAAAATNP